MALQKDYTHPGNKMVATDAYHKISNVNFFKGMSIVIYVDVFKSSTEAGDGSTPIDRKNYAVGSNAGSDWDDHFEVADLDVANQNIIERSYEYLKLHSDYSGATDV
jgi:hypothetical protein